MGWAFCGTDSEGREIGYGVAATCDAEGCEAQIDRGLGYACGGRHGETDEGCEGYFCGAHLGYVIDDGAERRVSPQLCEACAEAWEPDKEAAGG